MANQHRFFNLTNLFAALALVSWIIGRLLLHGSRNENVWDDFGWIIFGVLLVWFRDGFHKEPFYSIRYGHVVPTPPFLIALAGWFFILGMPVIMALIRRQAL